MGVRRPALVGIPLLLLALGFSAPEEQPVRVELIAEHASVQPGGTTRVGVRFNIDEGWHIYAKQPGEAGLPTKIAWKGPPGASFGPFDWPTPQPLKDPGHLRIFGYTGVVIFASRLRVARAVAAGTTLPIRAKVEWLACKELCLPGSVDLSLALPVSANPPVASTHADFFDHAP